MLSVKRQHFFKLLNGARTGSSIEHLVCFSGEPVHNSLASMFWPNCILFCFCARISTSFWGFCEYAREELECIELVGWCIWRSVCRYVGAFIVNQFASFFDENPPPQEAGTGGQGPSPEEGPPPGTMPNLTCLTCAAELCKLESSFPCLYFAVGLQNSAKCGGFRDHV